MRRTMYTLLLLAASLGGPRGAPAADIVVLDGNNYPLLVPQGKEVDAIYGDYWLANERIVAVIAQPTAWRNANMTVKQVAAGVIDLTLQNAQSDQLSAFYPDARQYDYRTAEIETASGELVALRCTAEAVEGRPAAELRYELRDGQDWIRVVTKLTNPHATPLTIALRDEVRADNTFEKAPNGPAAATGGLWWAADDYFGQAYGLLAPSRPLVTNSDGRLSTLNYLQGDSLEVQLAPGESLEHERWLFPAENRIHAWALAGAQQGEMLHPVRLTVSDAQGLPVAAAWVRVDGLGPGQGVARTDALGFVLLHLPAVRCELTVQAVGHGPAVMQPLEVAGGAAVEVALPAAGRIAFEVVDEAGRSIACKLAFSGANGTATPNFGHQSEAIAVGNLVYAPHGRGVQKLDPGEYDVAVTHGSEYDAWQGRVVIAAGQTARLSVTLPRSVATPGWVSTDFHSHASPSGDNTSSQLGRVLNLVAEHIEYAPCTEHNRIDTYLPHFDALGIHGQMATASGMELTGSPLPINHQNAFPLVRDVGVQDAGAPLPDGDPVAQIGRLALWDARSDKLVQQNHPDLGWMLNDQNADYTADEGFRGLIQFQDVMEVHRTARLLEMQPVIESQGKLYNNVAFNWLQFLNQGVRTPIVHNTDAHYNFHGSGGIRNYVRCSTDDPARIDTLEIVHECEAGHIILTNGPYLEVAVVRGDETAISGDELAVPDGRVAVRVRVQCPNWLDIDRVQILVNGRIDERYNLTRATHSDWFSDGVVKFDQEIPVEVTGDAHLIVLAVHQTQTVGPLMGPQWGSDLIGACTNPIYLDVDGGGFAPNGDTLGHPLPVAGGRPK